MRNMKNSYRELPFSDLYSLLDENLYVDGVELRRKVDTSRGRKNGEKIGGRLPVGYWVVSVFSRGVLVRAYRHQIVFILVNKEDPRGSKIDHMNGIRGDDRAENLRILSSRGNSFARHRTSAQHDLIGVHFRANRWEVKVLESRKVVFCRRFELAVDACRSYWEYREARDPAGVAAVRDLYAAQIVLAKALDEKGLVQRKRTLTGVPGVTILRGKYYAQTSYKGRKVHLGYFTDIGEAQKAFSEGRQRLGLPEKV